jgi:hypothetical protein
MKFSNGTEPEGFEECWEDSWLTVIMGKRPNAELNDPRGRFGLNELLDLASIELVQLLEIELENN